MHAPLPLRVTDPRHGRRRRGALRLRARPGTHRRAPDLRYRIVVPPQCLRTAGSGPLRFEGDPITGRVCGFPGDAVLLRDARCPIQSMQVLAEGDDGSAPP